MGSGKSTLGRILAQEQKMNFIDFDDYLEQKEGKKIKDIFEEKGEIYFTTLLHQHKFERSRWRTEGVDLRYLDQVPSPGGHLSVKLNYFYNIDVLRIVTVSLLTTNMRYSD